MSSGPSSAPDTGAERTPATSGPAAGFEKIDLSAPVAPPAAPRPAGSTFERIAAAAAQAAKPATPTAPALPGRPTLAASSTPAVAAPPTPSVGSPVAASSTVGAQSTQGARPVAAPSSPPQPPAASAPTAVVTNSRPAPSTTSAWQSARAATAPPQPPPHTDEDARLFPEEGSAEGCASGDCLPGEEPRRPALPVGDQWRAAVDKVRAIAPRQGASLAFGRLVSLKPGEVVLAYPREAGFHRTTITAGTGRATIEKALAEHFGQPTRIVLEESSDAAARAAPSLAEQDLKLRADHERSTEAKVRTHPAMRAVLKALGGEIEHIQVLDRERPSAQETEAPTED